MELFKNPLQAAHNSFSQILYPSTGCRQGSTVDGDCWILAWVLVMAWWGDKVLFLLFCFCTCSGLDCFYTGCDNPWYLLFPTWSNFCLNFSITHWFAKGKTDVAFLELSPPASIVLHLWKLWNLSGKHRKTNGWFYNFESCIQIGRASCRERV